MADLKVLLVPTTNSGVSWYRQWTWAVAAHRTRTMFAECLWWRPDQNETAPWEVDVDEAAYRPRILGELNAKARMADVAVFDMVHTMAALNVFLALKEAYPHIPVLAQIDDNILSTPTYNPASNCYDPGMRFRDLAVQQFRAADGIIVSTPYLKELYSDFNDNIYVVPNSLDFKVWDKVQRRKHSGIKIGWAGGASHDEDLRIVEPIIHKLLEKYSQLRFAFVHGTPHFLRNIPRVEHISKFTRVDKYPAFLASRGFDIGIAPLVDNAFNRGKSNLRWLEYSGMRVPCVASNVGHFAETINRGKDGLLCDDEEDWIEHLSYLIENKKARKEMGNNAYLRVRADFNTDTSVKEYEKILRQVVEKGAVNPVEQTEYAQPIGSAEQRISNPQVVS